MQFRKFFLLSPVAIAPLATALFAQSSLAAPLDCGRALQTLTGHSAGVTAVAFSPDGKTLASTSRDSTIKLWEVNSGTLRATFTAAGGISSVVFSPDGKTLASGGDDGNVILWDIAIGKSKATLSGHTDRVKCLAFAPNGAWLASGSADHTIRLWESRTGKLKTVFKGHSRAVLCLAFSRYGKLLASGGVDETVRFWNIERGREQPFASVLPRANQGPILALAFSPDGYDLAIVTCDLVDVWSCNPPQRRYMTEPPRRGSVMWNARFLPKGALLAIGSGAHYVRDVRVSVKKGLRGGSHQPDETVIRVWDPMTLQDCGRFDDHRGAVKALDLSRDGVLLASGSNDKTVRLWRIAGRQTADESPPERDEPASSDDSCPQAWDASCAGEVCGWDCGGFLFEASGTIHASGGPQRARGHEAKGKNGKLRSDLKEAVRNLDPVRIFNERLEFEKLEIFERLGTFARVSRSALGPESGSWSAREKEGEHERK